MSKIEWTDKTWNPVTGCTKVSQGCKNCYAERMYERFHGHGSFKNVICHEDRLLQPLSWKKPAMVFVNSMSDLFHEDVPFEFIDKVFAVMALCGKHTFQILTKRPQRMIEYFRDHNYAARIMTELDMIGEESEKLFDQCCRVACLIPLAHEPLFTHIWLGVSVEDQKTADERIPQLLQVPAAVRFLSCEPLLSEINFYKTSANAFPQDINHPWRNGPILQGIHWLICGGESGPGARPMHPDWARSLRDQCQAAGVAFFFKQWGNWKPLSKPWEDDTHIGGLLSNEQWLNAAGGMGFHGHSVYRMRNVGKKDAGRLLDGKLYDEFPKLKEHATTTNDR